MTALPAAAEAGEQLFSRALRGDRAALEDLIRREWPRVHRILAAETGSRIEAEDLTQEAFARVLPRLATFAGEGALAAYLDQVARNLARDRRRRRRFLSGTAVDDRPTDRPGPEAEALHGLDRATVRAAVRRLPIDYRTVLRLRLQEGLSSGETALVMGRSAAAVRQLQHRALVVLRQEYQAGGGDIAQPSDAASVAPPRREGARAASVPADSAGEVSRG